MHPDKTWGFDYLDKRVQRFPTGWDIFSLETFYC